MKKLLKKPVFVVFMSIVAILSVYNTIKPFLSKNATENLQALADMSYFLPTSPTEPSSSPKKTYSSIVWQVETTNLNPFSQTIQRKIISKKHKPLRLHAILNESSQPVALINGQTLAVHDRIQGYIITAIQENSVFLKDIKNHSTHTLQWDSRR